MANGTGKEVRSILTHAKICSQPQRQNFSSVSSGKLLRRRYDPQRQHMWRMFRDSTAAGCFIFTVQYCPTKLLYLTGDNNRNTFFNILGGTGVSLHSLEVYEACTKPWEAPLSLEIATERPNAI